MYFGISFHEQGVEKYLDLFVIIICDNLIYSMIQEGHATHMKNIFKPLKIENYKFSDREFWLQSFAFLGHVESSERI